MKLKITSWLNPTLEYLWKIRKSIIQSEETSEEHLGDIFGFYFGYPDYAGLSKSIADKIPNRCVTIIHEETYFALEHSKNEKEFFERMLPLITSSTVVIS